MNTVTLTADELARWERGERTWIEPGVGRARRLRTAGQAVSVEDVAHSDGDMLPTASIAEPAPDTAAVQPPVGDRLAPTGRRTRPGRTNRKTRCGVSAEGDES